MAPDTFNIVDISAQSGGLNNDQRRNLGSVAKILQFVATKKGVWTILLYIFLNWMSDSIIKIIFKNIYFFITNHCSNFCGSVSNPQDTKNLIKH